MAEKPEEKRRLYNEHEMRLINQGRESEAKVLHVARGGPMNPAYLAYKKSLRNG